MLTGKCTVITAEGITEITAPYTFTSKAGVQKVVVVHEDCQWQTLHVTNKTDLEEIEKDVSEWTCLELYCALPLYSFWLIN